MIVEVLVIVQIPGMVHILRVVLIRPNIPDLMNRPDITVITKPESITSTARKRIGKSNIERVCGDLRDRYTSR